MYDKILVPIELAQVDRAGAMLDAAVHLLADGGQITCLTVLPDIPGYAATVIPEDVGERMTKEVRDTVTQAVAATGVDAAIEIRAGHPAQTILKVAKDSGAGLIIVGSHQPGLEDYLLGTTASRVVRHATCDVLVQR